MLVCCREACWHDVCWIISGFLFSTMSLVCWSILSMSNLDPRNHVGCSHWLGPSSPQVMRTPTPLPSMPSAGNSTSSGVGAAYLRRLLFNVTHQPYRQGPIPIPIHQIYSVSISLLLLMALRNWCSLVVLLYNKLYYPPFFGFCFHSFWCQRETTLGEQTADLHTAPHRGHGQGMMVCAEYVHEGTFTASHDARFWSLHFTLFRQFMNV